MGSPSILLPPAHHPETVVWGHSHISAGVRAIGADPYGFPMAHERGPLGGQPAPRWTCKVRGRQKSWGCLTPPCSGCTHGCAHADSATTGNEDLWDIVSHRGREPRKWGAHGTHSCIPGLLEKGCRWCQNSWTWRFLLAFSFIPAKSRMSQGNPLLSSQEAKNYGRRMGHVTGSLLGPPSLPA